jgi:DNA end-binding protein Ku
VAVLTAREHVLVLQNLRYPNEVVKVSDLHLGAADLKATTSEKERQIADRLVQGMTTRFDPAEHHDTYRDDLLALIQKRIKSGQTASSPEAPEETATRGPRIVDLLSQLKQSLNAVEGSRGAKSMASSGTRVKSSRARAHRAPRSRQA